MTYTVTNCKKILTNHIYSDLLAERTGYNYSPTGVNKGLNNETGEQSSISQMFSYLNLVKGMTMTRCQNMQDRTVFGGIQTARNCLIE